MKRKLRVDKQFCMHNNLSSEQQIKLLEDGTFRPSYMWNQNGWLCSKMNLTPISQKQVCRPITHHKDLFCDDLGIIVRAGDTIGLSAIVTTLTKEGITIETECVGKVFELHEYDYTEWHFSGIPETSMRFDRTQTLELTCANLINHIPALMNSQPGYVTTERLDSSIYLLKPINEYI